MEDKVAQRVAVAMSGGVDSSVAAHLLQQEGREVVGLFMRTGADQGDAPESVRRVADVLGIELIDLDLSGPFREVIDYFCDEYCRGRTPNPCILCNPLMKFGHLFREAEQRAAELLATGHYARIERRDRCRLLRGVDPAKDQSYFLCRLTQAQLARALFPNGDKTKGQVREIARTAGLPVVDRAESQEVCFIPENKYRRFLRERRPDAIRKGKLRDIGGAVLAEHEGHPFFTIGQRRGLGIAVGEPRYVVRIDAERNEVIVGPREDLFGKGLTATDVNWVSIPSPGSDLRAEVQVRYAHRAAPATLRPLAPDRIEVAFEEPQFAITPGQAAVFYDGDILLGGGWIE
ncbi:MAG: tRNA 2-thiouridine(34) synthase MnmA [Planctomycetes bacterium]|nr:tRNA 2-thiouridine(34) synthase MnmA [Planctomycetota bacterium]